MEDRDATTSDGASATPSDPPDHEAGPGELLVSRTAWDRARLGVPPAEREVEIAGREGRLAVVSTSAQPDTVLETA